MFPNGVAPPVATTGVSSQRLFAFLFGVEDISPFPELELEEERVGVSSHRFRLELPDDEEFLSVAGVSSHFFFPELEDSDERESGVGASQRLLFLAGVESSFCFDFEPEFSGSSH